jgi:proteic killer suppression protein
VNELASFGSVRGLRVPTFNFADRSHNGTPNSGRHQSVGLYKLKGDRKGQWEMIVNERWRTCFAFRSGDAYDVEMVDYHTG